MFLGKGGKEENGRESPTQQLSSYFALKSHMQAWGGATPLQAQGTRITSSTLPDFSSASNIVLQRPLTLAVLVSASFVIPQN